ncbi:MAG TPA: AI-2E family transporter [Patescibacteria group bacterium]|nr:AI-2E family transporter [Patescibacteria group bacterium]
MTLRLRMTFFVVLAGLFIWFLYIDRAILTPFVLAAIFAYVFNPIVNFLYLKVKLPRTFSILIIYLLIMSLVVTLSIFSTRRILSESLEFNQFISKTVNITKTQINSLPDYIKPTAKEALISLEQSKIFSSQSLFSLFPQAISKIVSFFIFLFAAFYFLKDGNFMLNKFLNLIPIKHKIEVEITLRRINKIFGAYLRGQIFLVFIVSLILFIALSILGVKFALIISIFSGFAEIVPIIGPIVAGTVATLVVLISGVSNFNLTPIHASIIVIIIYFVTRQLEDYSIIPYVMGKITELHPLIILFAVISGGHLFGILGFILAVPIAGVIKIILGFTLDKINSSSRSK